MSYLYIFILILGLTACQHKNRAPNNQGSIVLQNFIQSDLQAVSDSKHATQLHNFEHDPQRPVILIIHGLHESPHYMSHWKDFFVTQNYQVVMLRLAGHFEKSPDSLEKVTAEQWTDQAETVVRSLSEKHGQISVLGYSTGGTLAAHLAIQFPQVIDKLFLISPALTLSNTVFLSGLTLGKTQISGQKICINPDALMCRVLKNVDAQANQMISEGLEISPQAGRQVQRLIGLIFPTDSNYYEGVLEHLSKIKTPTYIADTELDNVVNIRTNREWLKRQNQLDRYLLITKQDNVLHSQIARGPSNPFQSGPVRFNPQISKIENLFLKAMK